MVIAMDIILHTTSITNGFFLDCNIVAMNPFKLWNASALISIIKHRALQYKYEDMKI